MTHEQLSDLLPLVAVVASTGVSVASLVFAAIQANKRIANDYSLALMPRRFEALEHIWGAIFEKESGAVFSEVQIDEIVRRSIWLPQSSRERVLNALLTESTQVHKMPEIRAILLQSAGVDRLDRVQSSSLSARSKK